MKLLQNVLSVLLLVGKTIKKCQQRKWNYKKYYSYFVFRVTLFRNNRKTFLLHTIQVAPRDATQTLTTNVELLTKERHKQKKMLNKENFNSPNKFIWYIFHLWKYFFMLLFSLLDSVCCFYILSVLPVLYKDVIFIYLFYLFNILFLICLLMLMFFVLILTCLL